MFLSSMLEYGTRKIGLKCKKKTIFDSSIYYRVVHSIFIAFHKGNVYNFGLDSGFINCFLYTAAKYIFKRKAAY